MRGFTHGRVVAFIALALVAIGGAFAVADSANLVSPRTVEPHGEVFPPVDDVTGDSASAAHDELGASASSDKRRADRTRDRKSEKRRRGAADEDRAADETQVVAALIPARSGGNDLSLPCSDTNSCVDHVGQLITNVVDRVPDLPRLRECTSLIGGRAMCFDFGGGNYLVGDAPTDGQAELGFCTDSGYYYVSGPSLDGGAGAACPDDPAAGGGGGDAPTAHNCTSSTGDRATCFDFGHGNYLVSDPASDGDGELGFCTDSEYYYVSAPSAKGDAGAKCPGARSG